MKLVRLLLVALAGHFAVLSLQAQSVTPQNTVIDSEQLDMKSSDTEMTLVLTGNVRVTSTNQRLNCDRLEIVALRSGDPKATVGKIEAYKSLLATGNVRIIQGDREAACGKAEIKPGENIVILTGQPVVVDHTANVTVKGDELRLLAGQRQVMGTNVQIVGPALKDLGVDKDKLLAPAAPAAAEQPKQP